MSGIKTYKNKDYPKNPEICKKCKYGNKIFRGTTTVDHFCSYLTKVGHRRPKDKTDTWSHCSCFEEENKDD